MMEQKETKVDNVRLVLTDAQTALISFMGAELTHQLREEIKALTARIDRLYSHLGLRG